MSSTLTIRDLHEEIVARGHRHHAEVHLAREERAPRELAAQLGLATGAPVFHTLIVHHENGVPLQCEDRYVNPACAPDYLSVDFTQTTPTHYLLEVAPLWEAQYAIEASAPTAQEARLLGIAPRRPLPGRRAPHRQPRRADHPGAAGASGHALPARRAASAHDAASRSPWPTTPPQPWRNGGGVTRELLAWPDGGDWRVRVSVADIDADGPFSAFPGVERWFAVLEGAGVALRSPAPSTA